MYKKIRISALFLLPFLLTNNLFSAENIKIKSEISQDKAIQNFIAWDKNLKTLDTFYRQSVSFEETLISKSFGHILKNGNLLRIETLEEGKITQYALTDKKIIQLFDEKGNSVMNMSWQSWQDSQQNKSLFDFGNYEKIIKKHKVLAFEVKEDGYTLALAPKKGEPYTLTFDLNKDFFPIEITLLSEGVQSKTTLQDIKINTGLKEEYFK